MNRQAKPGKVDGVTVATIALALTLVLLIVLIAAAVLVYRHGQRLRQGPPAGLPSTSPVSSPAPKGAKAPSPAPATTQAATGPRDTEVEQMEREIDAHLKRVAELQAKLAAALGQASRPATATTRTRPSATRPTE